MNKTLLWLELLKIKTLGRSILPTFLGGSYGEPTNMGGHLGGISLGTREGTYHSPRRASRECIPPQQRGGHGPWAMVPMAPKGTVLMKRYQIVGSKSYVDRAPSDPPGGPMAPPLFWGGGGNTSRESRFYSKFASKLLIIWD